jgi:hypothetical protein
MNTLMLAALALGAIGLALAFAGRWRAGLGEWARALIISGLAVAASAYALSTPTAAPIWISGFLVCAALHRWIDAFTGRKQAEEESA